MDYVNQQNCGIDKWVQIYYFAILIGLNCVTHCGLVSPYGDIALQWRHDGRDGVTNHQPHDCLLKRLFRRRSKKTSKLRVTGLCEGNSPVTGEFPAQRASNAENVSIWWRHHGVGSKSAWQHQAITCTNVHYRNSVWFTLKQFTILHNEFANCTFKLTATYSRAQWVVVTSITLN